MSNLTFRPARRPSSLTCRWLPVVLPLLLLPAAGTAAVTIGDLVFLDSDGDGNYEPGDGETGVSGVTVTLYSSDDDVIGDADDVLEATDTTDGSGNYSFAGFADSRYFLVFAAPTGKVFTATGGDSVADRDGYTAIINGTGGGTFNNQDAGLTDPGSIGDFVWVDTDGDGVQDTAETGLSGVTVKLYDTGPDATADCGGNDDTLVDTETTNSSGVFSFTSLSPGDYYILVTLPAGYAFSPQDQGGDDTADSDVDDVTGCSAAISLAADTDEEDLDAGLYEPATVSGILYDDTDGDGIQDAGESKITSGDADVEIWADGAGAATDTANNVNEFEFTGLAPGSYYVKFTAPAGKSFVLQNRGSDDAADSDPDPDTGETNVFVLSSGEELDTVDAGVAVLYTIGDYVWLDADEDGEQDGGESGADGALVTIYTDGGDGEAGSSDDEVLFSTNTDAAGAYQFKVVAGDYVIRVTPLNGYSFTDQDQGGDDTADSDVDPATFRTDVFTVAGNDATRDAGLVADADGDGTPDSEDNCPNDAGKTEPGECGCGTADSDSDGDGVLDCQDNCPSTANADQADADGDGTGDACEESAAGDEDEEDANDVDLPRESELGDLNDPNSPASALADVIPNCGACGAVGMVSFGCFVGGYGALLGLRRRR